MFWQILFLVVLLIPLLAIFLDSQVGKALAARLERSGSAVDSEGLLRRLQTLESEIDRLSAEVDRLGEESEFLHKLLADRPPPESEGGPRLLSGGSDD